VGAADVKWRNGGLEQPGRESRVPLALPPEIELQPIPADETLSEHLDSGRIDALISALAPSCFGRNAKVQRLFPDYRAAEEDYFRRTRMFPIMHLVGIRRALVERHPWLAVNTYVAYLKAKELCYRHMETIGHLYTTLPWPVEEFQRARALMGDDFWSYGVEPNRRELTAVSRYAHEQGINPREVAPEELFAASTVSLAKI
jgi:4,5-dihydroxyphthalate decarboxylase